ncbi:hypothetical protein Vafri_1390 [Volvox africanus]|nr:hypothetical protein Vafri_1390 [Volvox africanus]
MGVLHKLFDVDIVIRGCEGLPRMDLVGHADPYFIFRITSPDGAQAFNYKSSVIYNTGEPIWDEEICLRNVPLNSNCLFQIIDKDHLSTDDTIGSCQLALDLATIMAASRSANTTTAADGALIETTQMPHGPYSEGYQLRLPIKASPCVPVSAGHLLLALRSRSPCLPPGPLLHCGPVRYRISISTLAGVITRQDQDDGFLAFAAYKLNLAGLPNFFPAGPSAHWNTSYTKACQVFGSRTLVKAVRAQHALLYQDGGQRTSRGLMRGGGDFVLLLRGGVRAKQRRYYTYVLMGDGSLCFSETGAKFFSDIMSKHAMHAGCAEGVVYAGEFCLLPGKLAATYMSGAKVQAVGAVEAAASLTEAEAEAADATAALEGIGGEQAGDWMLVVDNNSGTYAPPSGQLPVFAALLQHNFAGLRVEVLAVGDARLTALQARVPSRHAV